MDPGRRNNIRVQAKLKVRFKDVKAFIAEYTHNISKGGLFVRTKKACAQGSMVEVIIVMPENEIEISAIGEVIHVVTPEEASDNQPAGMGIELREIDHEDQSIIEEFIADKLAESEYGDVDDRRRHTRHEARIRVRFGSLDALIEEYAHNISQGGIFIRTGSPKPLNERVEIILTHPQSGEELILEGQVVRAVSLEDSKRTGQPPGMGVQFLSMDRYTVDQLEAFINHSVINNKEPAKVE